MLFSNDREQLRKMWRDAWQKRLDGQPASPLETQIADIVALHPEYHADLQDSADRDYLPEGGAANPYLHMGLHLALREQVGTDRPAGIRAVHRQICEARGDLHDAEHAMIEILAETLWSAQRQSAPPDEQAYLEQLKRLL